MVIPGITAAIVVLVCGFGVYCFAKGDRRQALAMGLITVWLTAGIALNVRGHWGLSAQGCPEGNVCPVSPSD